MDNKLPYKVFGIVIAFVSIVTFVINYKIPILIL